MSSNEDQIVEIVNRRFARRDRRRQMIAAGIAIEYAKHTDQDLTLLEIEEQAQTLFVVAMTIMRNGERPSFTCNGRLIHGRSATNAIEILP